ncbi:MAG: septum formation initiator [Verrucomicrobia bacterium]|nr:septum formation initiator [Verrucomicrobiota bacterium]
MKKIITSFFILASANAFAQTETLTKEDLAKELQPLKTSIQTMQNENGSLKSEISNLNTKLSNANKSIDSLKTITQENSSAISQTANQLGIQITTTEQTANKRIDEVGQSLSTNSLYGIIGVLSAILLSGFLYWLLSKRQQTDKTELDGKLENKTSILKSDVISEIEKTKKELQQENIKLDLKLIEVLENKLKGNNVVDIVENPDGNSTIDHSIPLKVADEITRINAYANTLDPNSQDAKALKSSVKRLINTFKASQYEIIDLLGQKYDDGMKVSVISYIPDEKIQKGEEVISRIIKPLVKYKGEQIQAAQVDVSIAV